MAEEGGSILGTIVAIIVVVAVIGEVVTEKYGLTWEQLGLICCGSLIALIFFLIGLAYLIKSFAERPAETLIAVTAPIWLPHYMIAALVLLVTRGYVTRWWIIRLDMEREAVRAWLWLIPALLATIWGSGTLTWLVVFHHFTFWFAVLLSVLSTAILWQCYYHIYSEQPPTGPDWSIFVGIEKEMDLEYRLAFIESKTKLKLWWIKLWS